jgi:hypothetical protein
MSRNTGGLGGISIAAQDAEAMIELREQLDSLKFASPLMINRAEIIKLLTIFASSLGPRLETIDTSEAPDIRKEHNAIWQLKKFIRALQDLDRGIVHDALRRATNQANAALSAEQMEFDNLLLEWVVVVQGHKHYKTLREAERDVAKILLKAGIKRRRKTITPATLRSLRSHPKKRQPRNPRPR